MIPAQISWKHKPESSKFPINAESKRFEKSSKFPGNFRHLSIFSAEICVHLELNRRDIHYKEVFRRFNRKQKHAMDYWGT